MQEITLIPNTPQEISVIVDNNTYTFSFYFGDNNVFMDIDVNGEREYNGNMCVTGELILDKFLFYDIESKKEDPKPEGFGVRWGLVIIDS